MNSLTRRYLPFILLLASLGVSACSDRMTDPRQLRPQQAGKEIVDGNHGGNTDVFFLPPVVSNPNKAPGYGDPFQPGLPLSFIVTDQSTNAVVKNFPPSAVQVDLTNQFYAANWNTKATTIDLSHQYRIHVVVGTKDIAHADVVFGANAASLKNVDTDDFITLVDGQTLPIKVRIEKGWDCLDKTSCVSGVVPTTIPPGQTVLVTTGGTLPNSVKFTSNAAGVWATNADGSPLTVPVVVTVQDVTSLYPTTAGGCANGVGIKLSQNHCIHITTDPVIKLASPATIGTCLASPGDDRQLLVKYSVDPLHPEPTKFLQDAPPPDNCPPPQIGSAIHSTNPLVRFAASTLNYVGRGLNWVAGVHTAYAFDTGVGGIVQSGDGFSTISPAFPEQMTTVSGNGQQTVAGAQTTDELVVHLAFVHDVGEGGLSPDVTGASLTCQALTPGAGFTATRQSTVPATELGNGRYSCGRPFLSQAPGANQFTVTADGVPGTVLFDDASDETIQLTGSVTFTETGVQQTSLINCDITPGGDLVSRGFYVPTFQGTALTQVNLVFEGDVAGSYTLSLTAHRSTYDGPTVGTASTTVNLTTNQFTPASFVFGAPAVTVGDTLAFVIGIVSKPAGSSSPFYGVANTFEGVPSCPITETEGTSPPLDIFRRQGVAAQIFGVGVVIP